MSIADYSHIIDFHVHPKDPDGSMVLGFKRAGLTHAVFLATDTDPADMDRQEIREYVMRKYSGSELAFYMPWEEVEERVRADLRSPGHIDNEKLRDIVLRDPGFITGFGSVDLSRDPGYVGQTLETIVSYGFRGIKLLPYSQFFDPETNENIELLFEFSSRHGLIILTHSGCAAGLYEEPSFNMESHPMRWRKAVRAHPDVPVVLAHFSAYSSMYPGIWFEDAVALMKECGNVYADTAAVWTILQGEWAVSHIRKELGGFDRVLFATDYPMTLRSPGGLPAAIASVSDNHLLSEYERAAVLGENAARLLGIN